MLCVTLMFNFRGISSKHFLSVNVNLNIYLLPKV